MLFQQIRTRLLILSDTHGHALPDPDDNTTTTQIIRSGFCRPLPPADVALHCGDLTLRSTPAELETTLDLMREVDAPLKLVIPGNHDSSLDMVFWERECLRKERHMSPSRVSSLRGYPQACAAAILRARARDPRLYVLPLEGTHHFVLPPHGARFTIFTSPWTPAYGAWGFQYDGDAEAAPHFHFGTAATATAAGAAAAAAAASASAAAAAGGGRGRSDSSSSGSSSSSDSSSMTEQNNNNNSSSNPRAGPGPSVDVVMTHGPPFGILDDTRVGPRAGCAYLLEAVARARPRVHCFGHIHESAGAMLVRWGDDDDDDDEDEHDDDNHEDEDEDEEDGAGVGVSSAAARDAEVVWSAPSGSQWDEREGGGIRPLELRVGSSGSDGNDDDDNNRIRFEPGKQTLFVNAAIMTVDYRPLQSPWLVDLELPLADEAHRAKAEETLALLGG